MSLSCCQPFNDFPFTFRIKPKLCHGFPGPMRAGAHHLLLPHLYHSPLITVLQPHWPSHQTLNLPGSRPFTSGIYHLFCLECFSPRCSPRWLIPGSVSGLCSNQLLRVPNHLIQNSLCPFHHFVSPYSALFFFIVPDLYIYLSFLQLQ